MKLPTSAKLKNFFHAKPGSHSRGPLAHADRDFRFFLIIFALLLVLSSVLHYAYYVDVLETQEPASTTNYPDVKVVALEKAALQYEQRQKDFDTLVSGR